MPHLSFTVQQLRRAYKRAGAKPCAGTWEATDIDGYVVYRCPINVVYGSASTLSAPADTGSSRECIVGFLKGWDGQGPRTVNDCETCHRLGVQLRAKLNPAQLDS
jgi:hypothetical protein